MAEDFGKPVPPPRMRATPLGAALAFTFMNSVGAGVTFNGIFFITKYVFGYGLGWNSALGVLLGVTYIIGALTTGPAIRWLGQRFTIASPRALLLGLILICAGINALPVATWFLTPQQGRAGTQWAWWVFIGSYSLLCGGLWSIVASYVSGGREPAKLPGAIGRYNITWSLALVVSMGVVSAVPTALSGLGIESVDGNVLTLAVVAGIHLASTVLLLWFGTFPGEHPHTQHRSPPGYARLLTLHRGTMPVVYTIGYALNPFLPEMTRAAGFPLSWGPIVGGAWLASRVATFAIMNRWHGWLGSRLTATGGAWACILGFAMCVACTLLPAGLTAQVMAVVGLVVFGIGIATVYVGALYYAMEVGAAAVDEGGKHEALIGLGYTAGPLCGLGAVGLWSAGVIGVGVVNPVMLGLVALTAGVGMAWQVAKKH